jgi:hypothetical protein
MQRLADFVRINCLMIARLQSADHYWPQPSSPREMSMCKSIAAIAIMAAILSLGSLVTAQAGGGATSAPSKYNNAGQNQGHSQNTSYTITEFSSSSARASKAEALSWKTGRRISDAVAFRIF